MKKSGQAAVYLLSLLLLLIGGLIIFFRGEIFSYLENTMVPETIEIAIRPSTEKVIDLDIFEDPRFKNMKKQVIYFDFNRLGRTKPENMQELDLPIFDPVYLRNSRPFQAEN